jgi:hypothetical protein
MPQKSAALAFAVLLVAIGAPGVTGNSLEPDSYHDASAKHKSAWIHCLRAVFVLNSQDFPTSQPRSETWSKISQTVDQTTDALLSIHWFDDHPPKSFSKRDLFRFEEVYRL